MNRLSLQDRARILGCLVEGNSLRATTRLMGCSINTVTKLLIDADTKLVPSYFPDALKGGTYDIVSMQALFPQLPDWKGVLLSMSKHARRYINVACCLRLTGTTVVDLDVSYFYYLDSGERVHQVIHQLYELVNFLSIREMNVKKIEFYGYHTEDGHSFRCVPNEEQIKGNLMLEMFQPGENPVRHGGASAKGKGVAAYKFFAPEMSFIIDGKPFKVR